MPACVVAASTHSDGKRIGRTWSRGSLKIIAAIEDPPVIVRILTHLGLPTRAPAQGVDLFQTT
jgi:hypothetical protein